MLDRMKKLKNNESGFTIIEVMIVLAIAGLIMLIVFLAIPALQRNQRNNARTSEGSRIAAAATECLANRNGLPASCLTNAALNMTPGTDTQQLVAINYANGGAVAPASSTTSAAVWYGRKCLPDGSSFDPVAGSTRQFVVLYTLEPNLTRCLGS